MRVSKVLSVVAGVGVAALTVLVAAQSSAGGDGELLNVACSGGAVTVTAKAPWHTNDKAPWKWDKGQKVSVDQHAAKFQGDQCTGTLKAYICNDDQCKGPILVPVK